MAIVNRWFVRCRLCLSIAAIDAISLPKGEIQCSACTGPIEIMGRVKDTRLVMDAKVCACDGRCTHAKGPNCDCSCGGKNHGTGALVSITVDMGAVPRINIKPTEKALAVAKEFREAMIPLNRQIRELAEQRAKTGLSRPNWDRLCYLE